MFFLLARGSNRVALWSMALLERDATATSAIGIPRVLYRLFVVSSPLLLNDLYFPYLSEEDSQLRLVLDLLFYIAFQTIIIGLAYEAGWFRIRDLGVSLEDWPRQLRTGLAILLVLFAIAAISSVAFELLKQSTGIDLAGEGQAPLPEYPLILLALYVFYLAASAGIYEEIVYRGIAIHQLSLVTRRRWIWALGSALLFSVIHWSIGLFIMSIAFVFGLFWAFLFIRTGRLVPIMFAHFAFDYVSFMQWQEPLNAWLLGLVAG